MMKRGAFLWLALAILAASAIPAYAQGGTMTANLRGFQEVPALSTPAAGSLTATVSDDGTEIEFELSYFRLKGNVLQAHIHFGQMGVNGGISIFFCSNLGNGPAGTPACPASPGAVSGTFTAVDVVGPGGQGIPAGDFAGILRAIRTGNAYANVHSDIYPGGEIRGQIKFTP
jgi:hypothetical protein